MSDARTSPPSMEANNQDVFIWALHLLGGSDRDVDVEEIYLKCFELAPARLGWRTHPEIPDYKKTSKALQSVEANTHVGLVHRPHKYSRRLTTQGIDWVTSFSEILMRNYSGQPVAASKSNNKYERQRQEVKSSVAWEKFSSQSEDIDLVEYASALQCSAASPNSVWIGRINSLLRAAEVLKDQELTSFAEHVLKRIGR